MTDHASCSTVLAAPKIAIIGGGLTGLLTATLLARASNQISSPSNTPQITIFEKSRSVGRLATRYRSDSETGKNWQWSFGAQFFTAKTADFQQFIAPWLDIGLLQPWCAEVVELTPANDRAKLPDIHSKEQWDAIHARYISTPKMTSWGRELATELKHTTIVFKTRVAPLAQYSHHQNPQQSQNQTFNQNSKQTELFDDTGASLGWFDWVICTAPNGQAVELMADSDFSQQANITKPQMQACYTLMLGWDDVQKLPETLNSQLAPQWDVAYLNSAVLDRIFIEHQKPAHDALLPSVTIHARNDWSQVHVDDDIEAVKAKLLEAAKQALNWNDDSAPSQTDCHRWRYAATIVNKDTKELGILVDETKQWIVSGDWCATGNIESCYQMAQKTVEAIWQTQ
ncbi:MULTISPECIES: NAD(P)-binding protein [unclassified Psychrobacter]|uniref:NAD(P)/FAD-dependent oxidoreductase n=1 Tax=unclassified Psychrobacter TaxID=196806 RepID=UPI0025B52E6E|nr:MULTISPECIES: NAD(P)-binding protein [unclassified Psychrobacter]MDN3453600.1 NAD(P)-binding protein [Psychrobacter sp. APC 3350]MDN3501469.1 NAD(P)-binding protein [Psychrobacter sp. 5A.1]